MLGPLAKSAIAKSALEDRVFVSVITAWELGVLVSKKRLDLHRDALVWFRDALTLSGLKFVGMSADIAVESTRPPWAMHPDPADRILVATARELDATLVTADGLLLRDSGLGWFSALSART